MSIYRNMINLAGSFCVIVDAYGLTFLLYIYHLHVLSTFYVPGTVLPLGRTMISKNSHNFWPTSKHKITNMRCKSRLAQDAGLVGFTLCPSDITLLSHLTDLSHPFHYQVHQSQSNHEICSLSPKCSLFPLFNNSHLSQLNICVSERNFFYQHSQSKLVLNDVCLSN